MKTIIIVGSFAVFVALFGIGLIWGHFLLNYDLMSIFGKSSDSFISYIIGIFLTGITFPIAIISWIAQVVGVHAPFIHV